MRVTPINNNNYNKQTNFKRLVVSHSANNVIKNFSKSELTRFSELSKRIENTKYWDLKIDQLGHDNDFFFNFYIKKFFRNKNYYSYSVDPYRVDGNVLYVSGGDPRGDTDDFNYDTLVFPSAKRAQEIYDNERKRVEDLYGKSNKYKLLTPLDRLENAISTVEYMEESYRYMTISGAQTNQERCTCCQNASEPNYTMHYSANDNESCNMTSQIPELKSVQEQFNKTTVSQRAKIKEDKITFANVGGQDEAIDILRKKVLYPIKYPQAFKNRMISHGIILHGRPGTGKSLIALALSNEADADFIKINAANLTSCLHGQTEQNWKELFAKAKRQQPCIVFVDEFDTVAQKRGHNFANNYDDVTLNQILAEMSDIEKSGDRIFIIGATNRFDELDDAAKRAGRFGTHIEIKAPETKEQVLQIFDIHTSDKNLDTNVIRDEIAQELLNKNATGAEIAAAVNDAIENCFIRNDIYTKMENNTFKDSDLNDIKISMQDFLKAIENIK